MDKWIKGNKITTTIIVVLVAFFGVVYFSKQPVQIENKDLKTKAIVSNVDLQTKCASQAKSFMDYYVVDQQEKQADEYTNHYNAKMDKCFVLIKHGITVSDGTFGVYTKNLFDAIEKKQYGSYGWQAQQGKKYWEVAPYDCTIYVDGNQNNTKTCTSEEEFDTLTSTYMEG